jgi:hypothetical protein
MADDTEDTGKLWYKSKLVWLGILQVVVAVLMSLANLLHQETISPADISLFLAGVVTIIIRIVFTAEPITKTLK